MSSRSAIVLALLASASLAALFFILRPAPVTGELSRYVAREQRLEQAQRAWEAAHPEVAVAVAYVREYTATLTPQSARRCAIEDFRAARDSVSVVLLGDNILDARCLQEHIWTLEELAATERPRALVLERVFSELAAPLDTLSAAGCVPFLERLAASCAPLPPPPPGYVPLLTRALELGFTLLPGDSLSARQAVAGRQPGAHARRDAIAAASCVGWLREHPDGVCVGLFANPRLVGPDHLLERLEHPALAVLRSDDRLLRRLGAHWQDPALLEPVVFPGGVYFLPLRRPRETLDWQELEARERRMGLLARLIQDVDADTAR